MKERKSSLGPLLLLLVFVIIAAAGLWYLYPAFRERDVIDLPYEESIPDDVPVVRWNKDNPEGSYRELSVYLSMLEPTVAIKGMSGNLEWEDICREHFWVDSFQISGTVGGDIKRYSFRYKDDAADNRKMQDQIDSEINEIIAVIPEDADDWNKALALHDELIRRISFDREDKEKHGHDIYGALVGHKAVCQGYTYSFTIIAEKIGLESGEIYSDTHIWNKLPGFSSGECYADITWDDIDRSDKNGNAYIIHDNFGLSKREIESLKEHKPEPGTDTEENKSGTGDNFFRKKGWYISPGDTAQTEVAVKQQLDSGSNIIELRFANDKDHEGAKDIVEDILRRNDYNGAYLSWSNNELRTYVVGLNPPDD